MRKSDGTPRSASIRRRIPSHQQPGDDEERSSIRVIHAQCLSPPERMHLEDSYASPRPNRKPVPYSAGDEEEDERVVIQSGNILMQQAALQAHQRRSALSGKDTLLPSPHLLGDEYGSYYKEGTVWPEDNGSLHGDEYDDAETIVDAWPDEEDIHSTKAAPSYKARLPAEDISTLTSSRHAESTLHDLNRSLQWTLKFPQGSHLSRANSRNTIRSTASQPSAYANLTEARAGLRMLAKKREDLIQDHDNTVTRVATWNLYKITLLLTIVVFMLLALLALIVSLLIWANSWKGAELRVIIDTDIVIC